MKKLLVVALVTFMGMAQAFPIPPDDGHGELYEYYENNPSLLDDDGYSMMVDAWACEQDAFMLRVGADYKSKGISYQEALKKENYRGKDKELNEPLLKLGYGYVGPLDPRISKHFTLCMIEQHKKTLGD